MTKYFKQPSETGEVKMLLTYEFEPTITDPLIVKITKEEYDELLAEITAEPDPEPTDEITDSEALSIILGGDG